ncbi:glycosyltransferase family 39 protein [Aeromicrobium sp.]|uniref:glycosyltransferase family 39 protein n=1 Tax=Aeromicrobium sp. TaxID=1871063 RepID=UPI002FC5D717
MADVAARRPLAGIAIAVGLLLLVTASRYGYHRDELYFIAAGDHPAFGYTDQPPLVPLLAWAMDAISAGSLTVFRLPSAIAAALTVFLTGLIAYELGGSRRAQILASVCMAVASITYAVGHLVSTTTYDLLVWAALSWLLIRAVRDDGRIWLVVGVVAGIGLQVKVLVAFLLFAVAVSIVLAGPRSVLRSRWMWCGGLIAVALWSPHLLWQAQNEWPQVQLADSIAAGNSGTSEPRWVFLPAQLVLVSPLLFPIWMVGWWQFARSNELRAWRFFAVSYVVLAVVFIATGGKPYYIAGLYPVLLAAGAEPTLRWVERGRARLALLGVAVVGSLAAAVFLFLPVVPVNSLNDAGILDINYDAGETVGWPEFADTVAGVVKDNTSGAERPIVLAGNYGEAGAMLRYRPNAASVFSVHNSFWTWGPPPEDTSTAVVVGMSQDQLYRWFERVEPAATIDNGAGVDNDEQGEQIWVCSGPIEPWASMWPEMRRLG